MYKAILKPSDAEGHILNYKPGALHQAVPASARDFIRNQETGAAASKDFEINALVAENTGLGEIERRNFNARVEGEVLARLKGIEEKAYAEAYALGLKEGREKAYADGNTEIKAAIESLGKMADSITTIKGRLFIDNEAHVVKTIFHLAKAIALKEIQSDQKSILNVLKTALENAQSEEEIKLRLSSKDNEFIESIKGQAGHPFERVARLKVEVSDQIEPGGCIVETNYGVVDATIDQRIKKLWTVLESKIPKAEET